MNNEINEDDLIGKNNNNIFMGIDLNVLFDKYYVDNRFLKNGCIKELVELTNIDIDDAKDIVEDYLKDYLCGKNDNDLDNSNNKKDIKVIIDNNIEKGHFYLTDAVKEVIELYDVSVEQAKLMLSEHQDYIDEQRNLTRVPLKVTRTTPVQTSSSVQSSYVEPVVVEPNVIVNIPKEKRGISAQNVMDITLRLLMTILVEIRYL